MLNTEVATEAEPNCNQLHVTLKPVHCVLSPRGTLARRWLR